MEDKTLWWLGKPIKRDSREYQVLLDRAYLALGCNKRFQKTLLSTGKAVFGHSMGKTKESETVLTIREFCSRLHFVRDILEKGKDPGQLLAALTEEESKRAC